MVKLFTNFCVPGLFHRYRMTQALVSKECEAAIEKLRLLFFDSERRSTRFFSVVVGDGVMLLLR